MEKKHVACIYKETRNLACTSNGEKVMKDSVPIYPEYQNTIIRWGKEEAIEEAMIKGKNDNGREFLY